MPSYVSSKRRPRRHFKSRRGSGRPVKQYQLRRTVKRLFRRIPRPQRKYLDLNNGGQIPTWADSSYVNGPYPLSVSGTLSSSSYLQQGVTQNEMIGYKGTWKSTRQLLSIAYNPTLANDSPQWIRVTMFWWRPNIVQSSGGSATNAPTVDNIFQQGNPGGTSGLGTAGAYISPYNIEFAKCYSIIMDKIYTLTSGGQNNGLIDKLYKKLHKNFQTYQPNQNNNGLLYDNTPYIMFTSNQNTPADQPIINYYSRLTYINS